MLLGTGYEHFPSVLAVQPVVHSVQALLTAGVAERFTALTSAINPLSISIILSLVLRCLDLFNRNPGSQQLKTRYLFLTVFDSDPAYGVGIINMVQHGPTVVWVYS